MDPTTPREFCLLVTGESTFATHWLPAAGEVLIGSASDADVVIPDAAVAPKHARLAVTPAGLTLTDLTLAPGVTVDEQELAPGGSLELRAPAVIRFGKVLAMLQRRLHTAERRICTHAYFEPRVEEQCIRAERFQTVFSILRLSFLEPGDATAREDTLSRTLRAIDVVASDGPSAYHILLETGPEGANRASERIRQLLPGAQILSASYPAHGRSADELLTRVLPRSSYVRTETPFPTAAVESAHAQDRLVERIAGSAISVLVLGETGVGKELMARRIHQLSPRASKPFIGLNASALPETLLESELFGYERGAFTGAVGAKMGLLEAAHGGTVFLDEVGELPLSIQVKLLRVLETREVLRLGSLRPRSVDVRFLAATNVDLELAITQQRFRQDLYFRLNAVSLIIPPLRERTHELPALAGLFLAEAARARGLPSPPTLSPEALQLLADYRWPGNVRELRNVIERAVLLTDGPIIGTESLPVEKLRSTFAARTAPRPHAPQPSALEAPRALAPPQALPAPADAERRRIIDVLASCSGNQTQAAHLLGISRRTLINRMSAFGVSGPRKRRTPLSG